MSKGSLPKEAAQAFAQGRRRFVCRINQGAFQMSFSSPLYGIAEVIEGIEAMEAMEQAPVLAPGRHKRT